MTLVTPADAEGPVPVMMMFGGGRRCPAIRRRRRRGGAGRRAARGRRRAADPPATEQLIADGWGYASINPASIQADNGAGLTRGIIGLVNKGQPRKPDDWGALRAWAWGASRGLDYLETDKAVDAKKVGIEGVSRYGKAALVTMAYDQRFAVVLVGSSGEGGAKLHRRNFGEAVENLTGTGEYHWMAGNFLKYGAVGGDLRQQERRRPSRRRARADRALRAAPDLHQLRRAREGRREVARSAGQLHGGDRRAAGVPAARREGSRPHRTTTRPRRCRRSTSACSTASSPGGSTTAATPTGRTGRLLHSVGRPVPQARAGDDGGDRQIGRPLFFAGFAYQPLPAPGRLD